MAEEYVELGDTVDELDRTRVEEDTDDSSADDESTEETTDADESSETEETEESGEEDSENKDGEEEDGEVADEEEGEEEEEAPKPENEIKALRQMVRAQRLQMKEQEGTLKKLNQALVDKDIIAEDEVADEEDAAVVERRSQVLDEMVELMELNPKFEDVKVVCSQGNFDDVAELLAEAYVREHGGDAADVAGAITENVWAKANPYKTMYDLVKTHHPDFQEKQGKSREDLATDALKGKKKSPSKKETAPSLSQVDGGEAKNTTGWTAARIDRMTEDELSKVPADVYEKYMRDELS